MDGGQRRRTVVYDPQFEREAAALEPDVRRLDEAMRLAEWTCALHPERGLPTSYPGVRLVPLVLPANAATLIPVEASVFYTYDDDNTYVLSIKPKP